MRGLGLRGWILLAAALAALASGAFALWPRPPAEAAWQRLRASGRLRVATSPDQRPFSFYNEGGSLDGFDVALLHEAGGRLGLRVEFVNVAYDGLIAAVETGQADAAAGGLSVSPEAAARVSFSNVYYAGEDALLARPDMATEGLSDVAQLAGVRLGALSGGPYADFVARRVPTAQLQLYRTADDAVRDVAAGHTSAVLLERRVAERYAAAGGAKIIGGGMHPQRLAVAVPRGSAALQNALNRALAQLRTEGVTARLAEEHLGLAPGELLPLPEGGAVEAAAPAGTPPACVNALTVESAPAAASVPPGQAFTRVYRLRNSGACAWTSRYRLVFAQGNVPGARMGGAPGPIGDVAPGATVDLTLRLVAPLEGGAYDGWWQLVDQRGVPFGERLPADATVRGFATPTPAPTAPPGPGPRLEADRARVTAGERVTLAWDAGDAAACYLSQRGEAWESQTASCRGERAVYPLAPSTWELRARRAGGTMETRALEIAVEPPAGGAPRVRLFASEPDAFVPLGQCLTLRWHVGGDVTSVTLRRDGAAVWEGAPLAGTFRDCPRAAGATEYVLEASGAGGTARAAHRLAAGPRPTPASLSPGQPTPTPTPGSAAAVVARFDVSPARVRAGECVTITWRVGGGAAPVRLERDGAIVLDEAPAEGTAYDCPAAAGALTYRVEAVNSGGPGVWREQRVDVTP